MLLKNLIHRTFFVDKLVLVGHTIFATGHLRYVVTTIDKPIAIRANAYESLEESSNDIRRKSAVLVEIGRTEHFKLRPQQNVKSLMTK